MSDQQSVRQVNGEKPRARVLVLYLLLVSLAMFLVLEFFCRIMVPAPFKMGTLVEDEVFGAVPGGFEAYTAAAKGPDLKRMLLLGDSFSEGSGARSRSEGFAGLLARRLKDEAMGWELVNAGVRGWGRPWNGTFWNMKVAGWSPTSSLFRSSWAMTSPTPPGLRKWFCSPGFRSASTTSDREPIAC
jgi:hypothetical protein